MKRSSLFTVWIAAFVGFIACHPGSSLGGEQGGESGAGKRDILIVYLSRTGNTQTLAEIIHDEVGGTLVELELATSYPRDYKAIVAQVDRENETGYLPALRTKITNIHNFETVFVGFPTWDMQLPPPVKTFFKEYDLSGKTVVPFSTHGGYGTGSSFKTVEELCPRSKILQGLVVRGGLERDGILLSIEGERRVEVRAMVRDWLRRISMP